MSSGIYLIQGNNQLVEMAEQPYQTEDLLQGLLAKHPSLLAGKQMNPDEPRRWLLVAREAPLASEMEGTGRWSVDHLFLDQDGIPTIVEVKRSSDTRIRREVVGQMLEYAANGVLYWPIERLRAQFDATCAAQQQDPDAVLDEFLADGSNPDEFWASVKRNLQAGQVRLVFVADAIPAELQRIVEFLNGQMNPAEVLAVEIKQYIGAGSGEGFRTLIPRVIGHTAQAQLTKSVGAREYKKWDETSYFEDVARRNTPEVVQAVRRIYEWAKANASDIAWGSGKANGSFVPRIDHNGYKHRLIIVWTGGYLEFVFTWMQVPPFSDEAKRLELLSHINEIPGVAIPKSATNRNPTIALSTLRNPAAVDQLLKALDWAVQEIRST